MSINLKAVEKKIEEIAQCVNGKSKTVFLCDLEEVLRAAAEPREE